MRRRLGQEFDGLLAAGREFFLPRLIGDLGEACGDVFRRLLFRRQEDAIRLVDLGNRITTRAGTQDGTARTVLADERKGWRKFLPTRRRA